MGVRRLVVGHWSATRRLLGVCWRRGLLRGLLRGVLRGLLRGLLRVFVAGCVAETAFDVRTLRSQQGLAEDEAY